MNRVWTFVTGKPLADEELAQLVQAGRNFVEHWTAHEKQLHGVFDIIGGRIVVVKVNEQAGQASGCSIDKLTRFMKVSESMFGIELLNRMNVAYRHDGKIEVVRASDLPKLIAEGAVDGDTIVYNTAASNEEELARWEQPLKQSWLKKYLQPA